MNQFKGTPGPYIKNGTSIMGNGKTELVAVVYGFDTEERKANAHLIAAAPDLLEALQNLVQLKEWKDRNGKDEHYEKAQLIAWEAARAAISKALNKEV